MEARVLSSVVKDLKVPPRNVDRSCHEAKCCSGREEVQLMLFLFQPTQNM